MTEHVVCDRERLAYIKTESQAPKTEQQNTGYPPNIYWCMPQRVDIGVQDTSSSLIQKIKKLQNTKHTHAPTVLSVDNFLDNIVR
jgi:hypothetical protein